jgi:hypothetical protein
MAWGARNLISTQLLARAPFFRLLPLALIPSWLRLALHLVDVVDVRTEALAHPIFKFARVHVAVRE